MDSLFIFGVAMEEMQIIMTKVIQSFRLVCPSLIAVLWRLLHFSFLFLDGANFR